MATTSSSLRHMSHADDLLLRETHHRCGNDLQLIVSLLALQSRRAVNPEVREALDDAMKRVAVVARTRHALHRDRPPSLNAALLLVCEALQVHAEPRGILLSLHTTEDPHGLHESDIATVALVVNELATNAIKHAFVDDRSGHVLISVSRDTGRGVTVVIDDDGCPFPDAIGNGLGMGLVKRLMASIGGLFIPPQPGSKLFELRVPLAA